MAHHDKVNGTAECEEVGFDVCLVWIIARVTESYRLTGVTVEEDRAVRRHMLALEVGQFDVEVGVKQQVVGLDFTVKHAEQALLTDNKKC